MDFADEVANNNNNNNNTFLPPQTTGLGKVFMHENNS